MNSSASLTSEKPSINLTPFVERHRVPARKWPWWPLENPISWTLFAGWQCHWRISFHLETFVVNVIEELHCKRSVEFTSSTTWWLGRDRSTGKSIKTTLSIAITWLWTLRDWNHCSCNEKILNIFLKPFTGQRDVPDVLWLKVVSRNDFHFIAHVVELR